MKKNGSLLLAAALALCLAPAAAAGVTVGSPAPDFTLNDVNGAPHSLSDYWGRVVLLFFWTST